MIRKLNIANTIVYCMCSFEIKMLVHAFIGIWSIYIGSRKAASLTFTTVWTNSADSN